MHRQNANNRSILVLAGQQTLQNRTSNQYIKPNININKNRHQLAFIPAFQTSSPPFDPKNIVKTLGLARLRKMQALVRGFLVRRTIYPKQLKEYLLAQSLLDVIIANVIYREASGIIVQSVTLGHYDNNLGGQDRFFQQYLYNVIIKRVISKEFEPIARQAVYQTAMFASRPSITFGFNLRDPMQLNLYMKLNQIINQQAKEIAEQVLREQAEDRRGFHMINNMIDNMTVIQELCLQVANECLLQGTADYQVERIIGKMVNEAAQVISESVYNHRIGEIQDKFIDDLCQRAQQWLLQQTLLTLVLQNNPKNQKIQE